MKHQFFVAFLFLNLTLFGQKSFNDYAQFYPISEAPTIRFMSSYTKQETILFDANPVVRFSLFNNFLKGLMQAEKLHTQAWYIAFRPQLRMYTDNSLPVRTPSYKIFLGTQHLFRIPTTATNTQNFWGFSLESGHFSNGQDGSAFSESFPDDSQQSDSIYHLINASTHLPDILNRRSGNFSTNLTELIVNYRTYRLDDDNQPKQMHALNVGFVRYHNRFLGIADFGGFSQNDIKIYGYNRLLLGYEYMKVLENHQNKRYSIQQHLEIINHPHSSVNPIRAETSITFYPFVQSKAIGFVASYIFGHDNYNFRFVDAGHQLTFGITWSQFPPFALTNAL